MTDEDRAELTEVSAVALSHTALLTALFGLLEQKQVLAAGDLNEVLDDAMRGLETAVAHGGSPRLINRARQVLENTTRNLAGPPKRR